MEHEELEQIMGLIVHGGNAKSLAVEAIRFAKNDQFEEAEEKLKEANKALSEAHHAQTAMLTEEAKGNPTKLSLLMVHGQDHLMNAITFIDMAKEMIEVYQRLAKLEVNK